MAPADGPGGAPPHSEALLLVANAVTLFGSAFAFVPLGTYFLQHLPGVGFPAFLGARLLPGMLLASLYGEGAGRASLRRLVAGSELVAGLASLAVIAAVHLGAPWSALLLTSGGVGLATALKSLFPAHLRGRAASPREAHGGLARWYAVRALALMAATTTGGLLQPRLPLPAFLVLDALTFFFAAAVWWRPPRLGPGAPGAPAPRARPRLADYLGPANVANYSRNVFFGLFGASFPAFVFDVYHGDARALGWLYFVVGAASVGGAVLVRRLAPGWRAMLVLSGVELALLLAALAAPDLLTFAVPVGLACAAVAALEVLLQTAFITGQPLEQASRASAVFQASENAASLTGYALAIALAPLHLSPQRQLAFGLVLALLSVAVLLGGRERLGAF